MRGLPPLLLVCVRVGDRCREIPKSVVKKCEQCGHDIVVTPAGLERPELKHPESMLVCTGCSDLEGRRLYAPTLDQRTELHRAGHNPDAWALKRYWGRRLPPAARL